MAGIKFKGNPVQTNGDFPQVGDQAPDFKLVKADLSEITLSELKGKQVVFNVFPSIDTDVCALQMKTYSEKAAAKDDVVMLYASMDSPFALKRFCEANDINNAVTASDFRYNSLAENYGLKMIDGPLNGLYARATLVLDKAHKVIHSELVSDVTQEPNYDAAMAKV